MPEARVQPTSTPKLDRMQPRVQPTRSQQLGMAALLGDAAGLEHDDPVSMLDGGQTVGDDQRGAALHQGVQRPNPPPNDFAKPHL